jgi:hypothetical protein
MEFGNTALIETLLENQRLMSENSVDIGQFKRISIPLIRREYPPLIANKLISVQPLLGPTGLAYYLRFKYSQQQQQIAEGWTLKKKNKWRTIKDEWEVTQIED